MNDTSFLQSDDEQQAKEIFENADKVYDWVMSRLNIDPDNQVYNELVLGMLERQTRDHILFSIWSSLDDDQAKHLKNYINETAITEPDMGTEDVIMEFAQMYPSIMDKVLASLDVFFENFIAKFNEIGAA